jgi:uracil-DNA glycosylase
VSADASPERPGAQPWVPPRPSLRSLTQAVQECRGCELYREATQGVMGAGRVSADLMLVGEQPGDREDQEGLPFVGPAGRLLDRALVDAGVDPAQVFKTNVVNAVQAGAPAWVLATAHPSAVLRSRSRDEDYGALVRDLEVAAEALL